MNNQETFVLQYRWKYSTMVGCLFFIFLFIFLAKLAFSEAEFTVALGLVVMSIILGFVLIFETIKSKKDYHYVVDRYKETVEISMGIRKGGEIPFAAIKGVAVGKVVKKGAALYYIQIAMTPDSWNQFNQLKEQPARANRDYYDEMYLTIRVLGQTEKELDELVSFIVDSGIERRIFVPSGIANEYPGKAKADCHLKMNQVKRPITVNQKILRVLNFLCMAFILFMLIIQVAISLLRFFGMI